MGFIHCPGCADVVDVYATACPLCGRCPGCGQKLYGTEACSGCGHPDNSATVARLERSFGIPRARLEHERQRADIRKRMYSWKAVPVLLILGLLAGLPMGLWYRLVDGWDIDNVFLTVVIKGSVFAGSILLILRCVNRLLERSWFPWMLRSTRKE